MGKGCGPLNRWSLYSINRWHAAPCYILEQSNFWSFGLLPLDSRRRQAQKANSWWSHSQLSTRIFFVSSEHSTGNVHPQKVEAFFEPGRNRDPLKNQDPPSNKTTFERSRGIWQTTRVILCRFSFYEYLMNLLNVVHSFTSTHDWFSGNCSLFNEQRFPGFSPDFMSRWLLGKVETLDIEILRNVIQ